MAGRVLAKGGETCLDQRACSRRCPEVRSQGRRSRRGGTSKGVAVCLCFPAIREISRGRYQGAPFGVPPPSLLSGARFTEAPTHAKQFAGSDGAWPERKENVMRASLSTSSRRKAGPIPSASVMRKVLADRGSNVHNYNDGGYGSRPSPGRLGDSLSFASFHNASISSSDD